MGRKPLIIAGAVVLALVAFASGYGYHRDELYFLAASHHLAFAYADQGPLTPLIAHLASLVDPDSLTVLRVPAALATGGTILITAQLAREFGGGERAATIAAACAAAAGFVLGTGHLLSTSTFDLLAWAAICLLVVRAVRLGDRRLWLAVGLVIGLGLQNKPLPAFLAFGLLAGVVVAGPRRLLRDPYVWGGAAIAIILFLPWLVWQAQHGWPQLDVSRSIAEGHSTSSEPWWAIVPYQVLLASPPLAPIWIVGLVRLFRSRELRDFRFLAWAWVTLAVLFMASGGKPYYLAGLLPVLIGAGAPAVDGWLARGRGRGSLLGFAIAGSLAVSLVVALPILPVESSGFAIAINADVAETIGWPDLASQVATVYADLPAAQRDRAVVLARNYGEAGAIDRYGPDLGLPGAYSGHNAYGYWGPPPPNQDGAEVIAINPSASDRATLRACHRVARIQNAADVDNDERGVAVDLCRAPAEGWAAAWPDLRRLG